MPELPEVETVCRGLEPVIAGKRLVKVENRRADLRFPFPERFAERLTGLRVTEIQRRAKYLVAGLSNGEALLMHLGMTGRFTVMSGKTALLPGDYVYGTAADPKHDHVVFHLAGNTRILYNDPRRFGFMLLLSEAERATHPLLVHLGPEPLGNNFHATYLADAARSRKTDLKAFLLDQTVVAGLGNIYVCEALFRCGLSPKKPAFHLARSTSPARASCENLTQAIRDVLNEAILAGGSTLRDYRHADGTSGAFQERFNVYGRERELCLRVGCCGVVKRIVQSGRSTFYCPRCQR